MAHMQALIVDLLLDIRSNGSHHQNLQELKYNIRQGPFMNQPSTKDETLPLLLSQGG